MEHVLWVAQLYRTGLLKVEQQPTSGLPCCQTWRLRSEMQDSILKA
jgi:hypothetical protein